MYNMFVISTATLKLIVFFQMTYLSKVAIDSRSYVTVFQMPFSIIRKIVSYVKKNNDTLLSLGIKGVQITGNLLDSCWL